MSFLFPVFLLGAIAVAIPVALHLLRRTAAPAVPFSAVRLLRRHPPEQTRRRTLRDLLLLAARVAAILLLAAAFARPYLAGDAGRDRLHIVAIDRSYSMGAPGAFERAAAIARDSIAAAGGDRVALVAFDDVAELIAEPGPAGDALLALRRLQPGHGGTRYGPMIRRAVQLTEDGAARLTVITDLQRSGWDDAEPEPVPARLAVDLREVDTGASNLAIAALRRTAGGVAATVQNTGPGDRRGTLHVVLDDRPVASVPFTVDAHSATDVDVASALPSSGILRAELDDPIGYPADNVRHLLLDVEARRRVLVVGGEAPRSGFYVSRALAAAGEGEPLDVRLLPAGKLTADVVSSGNDVVVLLTTRNLGRRAREALTRFVAGGGGILIAAGPGMELSALASIPGMEDVAAGEREGANAALAASDLRHPIFRGYAPLAANLGQARFTRTWRVRDDGWAVAARFTDGSPALLERRQGEGTVLLFASDLDRRWNDFPLHPAFAPFVLEAVRHLGAGSLPPREYLAGEAPGSTGGTPGIHVVGERRVAVNVDPREGAGDRLTRDEFLQMLAREDGGAAAPPTRRQAQQIEGTQDLWRYGLMLMLLVLVAESAAGRAGRHE